MDTCEVVAGKDVLLDLAAKKLLVFLAHSCGILIMIPARPWTYDGICRIIWVCLKIWYSIQKSIGKNPLVVTIFRNNNWLQLLECTTFRHTLPSLKQTTLPFKNPDYDLLQTMNGKNLPSRWSNCVSTMCKQQNTYAVCLCLKL